MVKKKDLESTDSLKRIFDSIGLKREQLAREFGVTRDAVQRMIRGGFVPLHHLQKLKDLSSSLHFDCEVDPKLLRAVSFKIKTNTVLDLAKDKEIKMAGLENSSDKESAYRAAMVMRGDLKRFTDLQLKHELQLRGWVVSEPTESKTASK